MDAAGDAFLQIQAVLVGEGPQLQIQLGAVRDDVDHHAALHQRTVHLAAGLHVLAQHVDGIHRESCTVQRILTQPGRTRSMGRSSVIDDAQLGRGQRDGRGHVVRIHMDHHGEIVVVPDAGLLHLDLARDHLFRGGAHEIDLRVQFFLQAVERQSCQHAYSAGDVVTAGMAGAAVRSHAGEGVVLCQDGHLVFILFSRRHPDRPEGVVHAGKFSFNGEAFRLQQRADFCAALLLLTGNLGVGAQPVCEATTLLFVFLQFVLKEFFFLFVVHR